MAIRQMPPAETATRLDLLAALRERPGATVAELARAAGVAHSTAAYHLARLERRGVVHVQPARGRRHCFLAGSAGPGQRALVICRRTARSEAVLARLVALGGAATLGPVAEGLGMTKSGVVWHLERLAALGLVRTEGPPRGRTYIALPGAAPAPAGQPLPPPGLARAEPVTPAPAAMPA